MTNRGADKYLSSNGARSVGWQANASNWTSSNLPVTSAGLRWTAGLRFSPDPTLSFGGLLPREVAGVRRHVPVFHAVKSEVKYAAFAACCSLHLTGKFR